MGLNSSRRCGAGETTVGMENTMIGSGKRGIRDSRTVA